MFAITNVEILFNNLTITGVKNFVHYYREIEAKNSQLFMYAGMQIWIWWLTDSFFMLNLA